MHNIRIGGVYSPGTATAYAEVRWVSITQPCRQPTLKHNGESGTRRPVASNFGADAIGESANAAAIVLLLRWSSSVSPTLPPMPFRGCRGRCVRLPRH